MNRHLSLRHRSLLPMAALVALLACESHEVLFQVSPEEQRVLQTTETEAGALSSSSQGLLDDALLCVDLIAGQTSTIGEVCVISDLAKVGVRVITTDGWSLKESHLAVAGTVDDIPQTRNGNPRVGHFPYKDEHESTRLFTYEIALESVPASPGDAIALAFHADVVGPEGQSEGAWADGQEFNSRGGWATHFGYRLRTDVSAFAFVGADAVRIVGPPETAIEGTILEIPEGAFEGPAVIAISEVDRSLATQRLGDSPFATLGAAGPALEIESTQPLLVPATLTLPLDSEVFAADVIGDILVLILSEDGVIELAALDPTAEVAVVQSNGDAVTFPVHHFTTFIPEVTSAADVRRRVRQSKNVGCFTGRGLDGSIIDDQDVIPDGRNPDRTLSPRPGGLSDVSLVVLHSTSSFDYLASPSRRLLQTVFGAMYSGYALPHASHPGRGFQAHYYIERDIRSVDIVPREPSLSVGEEITVVAEGHSQVIRLVSEDYIATHVSPEVDSLAIGIELLQHVAYVDTDGDGKREALPEVLNVPPFTTAQMATVHELLRGIQDRTQNFISVRYHSELANKFDPIDIEPAAAAGLDFGDCDGPAPPIPLEPSSNAEFRVEWEEIGEPKILEIEEGSQPAIAKIRAVAAGQTVLRATVTMETRCYNFLFDCLDGPRTFERERIVIVDGLQSEVNELKVTPQRLALVEGSVGIVTVEAFNESGQGVEIDYLRSFVRGGTAIWRLLVSRLNWMALHSEAVRALSGIGSRFLIFDTGNPRDVDGHILKIDSIYGVADSIYVEIHPFAGMWAGSSSKGEVICEIEGSYWDFNASCRNAEGHTDEVLFTFHGGYPTADSSHEFRSAFFSHGGLSGIIRVVRPNEPSCAAGGSLWRHGAWDRLEGTTMSVEALCLIGMPPFRFSIRKVL